MLFYCNFLSAIVLILFFEPVLTPNRPLDPQQIIEKDVTDRNILLSWPTTLSQNSRFNSLTIFIKVNPIDRLLALISPDSSVTAINTEQMPAEYRGRISSNEKGIILNKIDFEIDNGRIFYAILMFTRNGTLHEKKLHEIRLFILLNFSIFLIRPIFLRILKEV
ncbi:hypothetical protein MXB_574 [Myxobolus squamalis]|nr:hypothetical protein MXB_574 [Myxobolus squamalis]